VPENIDDKGVKHCRNIRTIIFGSTAFAEKFDVLDERR
jgi:hypothetical protein